ncbi:MAG: hypothetical protein AAGU18_07895 [Proteiniphilum sp.]
MQIYIYLWKNKIISDFSIDKYIRNQVSGVRIQDSGIRCQESGFSGQLLWLNVVRDSGLGTSDQLSASMVECFQGQRLGNSDQLLSNQHINISSNQQISKSTNQ